MNGISYMSPWAPRRNIPVSVDTRVRVDLFWKIILMEVPFKGCIARAAEGLDRKAFLIEME